MGRANVKSVPPLVVYYSSYLEEGVQMGCEPHGTEGQTGV